ncbi:FAD-dependent oxidoreductase [Streptomyces sp. NPDC003247]|uniref:FAD-dependent oxidoreductase n=1 Tax=Streptomyces sp. NPDC003247 TaxID=3364677 RepID=UPI0036A09F1F
MSRPRIVIVGAGFAGYRTARTLTRAARGRADITLLNPTDYFLYLPLLPQVAAGILEPRRVTVSLTGTLPGVRLVLGEADRIDLDGRTVGYTGPEGEPGTLAYDRLVLAAGSVNKLLPIPGVAEHAHGFRGLPEALYLRDHVTRQTELAAVADSAAECAARCTFVVVGAGYTGTEVAAQGQLFTDALARAHPPATGMRPRWLLLDVAERVLPELDERLSRTADRVLRERGVDVRTGTSVKEATRDGVLLTDGAFVDTRTLVWCVGVRPDPLAESLGLPMERGRLLVEPTLRVPGRPEVFACGDAAAVPDLEKPGQYTPMTAQHAWRQGRAAGHNIAASLTGGTLRPYRHKDKGFVVDLGGVKAAANPLGVPLSGLPAGAVTRGYHLAAMPGNRVRVAADWLLDAVLPRQAVQLGLVRSWAVPLDTASPELTRVPDRPGHRASASSGPGAALAPEAGGDTGTGGDDGTAAVVAPTPEPAKHPTHGEPVRHPAPGEPAGHRAGTGPAPGGERPGPAADRDTTAAESAAGPDSAPGPGLDSAPGPGLDSAPGPGPDPGPGPGPGPDSGPGSDLGPASAPARQAGGDTGTGRDDGTAAVVAPTPEPAKHPTHEEPARRPPHEEPPAPRPSDSRRSGARPGGHDPAPGPVRRADPAPDASPRASSEGDQ